MLPDDETTGRPTAKVALWVSLIAVVIVPMVLAGEAASEPLAHRWFRAGHDVADPRQQDDLIRLINIAADHGLNGLLLSTGFSEFKINDPATLAGLHRVKAVCDARNVELIPCIPGVGWGGALWKEDPQLIAGFPVTGALMAARGGTAVLMPEPPVSVANGDFERHDGNVFADIAADRPGVSTFADTAIKRSGSASLRMENLSAGSGGYAMCRVSQEVAVTPHRCYRISAWVKTENLRSAGAFHLYAWDPGLQWPPLPHRWELGIRSTMDWRKVGYLLSSGEQSRLFVYAGFWGAAKDDPGRLWIDDLQFEEVGPDVAVRRGGTPVVIRRERDNRTLIEGQDYRFPVDPTPLTFWVDYHGPRITLLPDGPARVAEGERLRADWYMPVLGASTHICMSEPKVYRILEQWIAAIDRELRPSTYLLSMDEVRGGCTCALCRSRGMTNGEILADSINRQFAIIRRVNPKAEVLVWGDMLDPNQNATPGDYEWVPGGFDGSWKMLNREIIIACWYEPMLERSLQHFTSLGHRVLGAAYYDSDNLDGCRAWLRTLRVTPGAYGIMYTTWEGKYALLPGFGDLVSGN
jgi:hypothetical protein